MSKEPFEFLCLARNISRRRPVARCSEAGIGRRTLVLPEWALLASTQRWRLAGETRPLKYRQVESQLAIGTPQILSQQDAGESYRALKRLP